VRSLFQATGAIGCRYLQILKNKTTARHLYKTVKKTVSLKVKGGLGSVTFTCRFNASMLTKMANRMTLRPKWKHLKKSKSRFYTVTPTIELPSSGDQPSFSWGPHSIRKENILS